MIKSSSLPGIALSRWRAGSPREHYWAARQHMASLWGLRHHPDFARLAWRDQRAYLTGGARPVAGRCRERAALAADWLVRAWRSTPDDGVSLGCFPCDGTVWRPSYPETTGYIITSLLRYARQFDDPAMGEKALAMARWEVAIQMASGAVQGGPVLPATAQTPAVFNTGMVLDGLCTTLETRTDPDLLNAAFRAADFLLGDLGPDG
ncbi:MAG: hypothetical protein HQM02_09900, partial [Magnetococcales bacterium]|nr:hypothetical protein [Magnetococcales bacterium]